MEDTSQYNSITVTDLMRLDSLNFKLVPLGEDAKTPPYAWTPIYENPNYWTAEKLEREAYQFKNVATVFGETRQKGEYLNELDIDSEYVFDILHYKVKNNHGEYESYVDRLRKLTFVVKTKKPFGYRIYWLSHKQNKPVLIKDCKEGHEFEIKTDKSCGHSTLPPSRHRDDANFIYEECGQDGLLTNDDLYNELINLLSDCLKPITKKNYNSSKNTELNDKGVKAVADIIAPFYKKGHRNIIILALSGLLRRFSISYDSALNIIQTVVKDDEEKRSRIDVLEQTYKKKPIDVSGTKYFVSVK